MSDPALEFAWQLYRQGRRDDAETRIREVLAVRPDDEWGLRLLAGILMAQDRLDEALEAAEAACRVAPDRTRPWIQLAAVRSRRHEPEDAVAAAQRAVAAAPHFAGAHDSLSRAYQTQREAYRPHTAFDPERALPPADEAVRLSPAEPTYRNSRAWALILQKRWKEAEREYHRVLAIAPDNFVAVNALGWRHRQWRPILAAKYYAAALELNPQSVVTKINLKGALRSWIYRMIWVWVWGGLALGVLRWVLPRWTMVGGVAGLLIACGVGTAMILRHVPRGSLPLLRRLPCNFLLPIGCRMALAMALSSTCALASRPVSLAATALLAVLAPLEWKVGFSAFDRWLMRRPREAAPDG